MLVKRGYCSIIDQLLASVDQETCRQFSVKNELKPIKQYVLCCCTRMYCIMFYQFVLVLLINKYQRQPIGKQTDRQLSVMNIALVHPSMLSYIIYCNTNLLRHGKHDMQ